MLRRLADDGHAVMVATHDVEFAAEAADQVVVLAEGEVVSDGTDPRGARGVTGVRPAGHQDPRPGLAARRRGAPMNRRACRSSRRSAVVLGVASVGRADDADLAAAGPAAGGRPGRSAVRLPGPAAGRDRGGAGRGHRGRARPAGAGRARRAVGGERRAARPLARHGRRRAGVLPADPGRSGVRRRASASCSGCTSLFASALLTGGVGPWLPYQMLVSAWVGMGAGLLPRRVTGRAEIAMLAAYGVVAAYAFGLLLNLSSWPFVLGIAVPGHTGSGVRAGRPARRRTCTGS